ncbi:ABC transporter ATP-binding protein [Rhodococcus sp. BP-149]|uniref:ABC transporter ATP-binding protein n=1 Tax=unclassified Rhodococcus (in: high G+C Gram-positive bacteria) TaxID=192944 RepID=UPI001C9B541E|nr:MULTISPECIES: ABC transporter ATP-binding protein [unclassified Rhodococcus (in: high G+C Gram-positive bacteria)]MBY6685376.1 ABC transporter ATP-binding protein [Rhodococcus sp. BP-288]MBY6696283.1 ABC transporter ATP-binding protein [Rhodococcus sp. BP-188]MBY6696922.1 ABC transporter ATP-binding protein [Rhodococcus sp. BP-285]MBY6703578.1 ABC transporter ATP-binding protein [Rhodococcus sp. BP-283]MBY6710468.1 ABC transporter ATP-binding protein [Rhodococcus sp. BP-160]
MTASASTPQAALTLEALSVSFATDAGPVDAVKGVSFEVFPGEVLAVVGESGSGKSVSVRSAIGLLPDTARVRGTVTVGSREVTSLSDKQWADLRGNAVAMVFQEPGSALDPLFTVGFQIVEALRAHAGPDGKVLDKKAARVRAIELLTMVGLPDPERRFGYFPHELSGGQKQRVMIAIAISCEAKVIIADEPTTALDVTVQAEILDLLRDLKDRLGCAIVLITHSMGVVADIADRVVVMKDGEVVEEALVHDLFAAPKADYTKTLLAAVPTLDPVVTDRTVSDEVVLSVRDLVVQFPGGIGQPVFRAVDSVTFDLHRGETLGLVGESGSGKSTIGRCVAALQKPTSGSVDVLGQDVGRLRGSALKSLRKRFGFVFQDPSTSLNPRLTVGQCIAEPMIVHKAGSKADIARTVVEWLDAVQLPKGTEKRYPHELSGGQRQRASLARALVLKPDLLVADEPTSALDVSVQAAVLDLFEELQTELHFACLFISHDLAVVDRLAHRVAVLRGGAVVELGTPGRILRDPAEEYTKRLIAAIPRPEVTRDRKDR